MMGTADRPRGGDHHRLKSENDDGGNGRAKLPLPTIRDLITFGSMLIAGLTWGMKLDNRTSDLSDRIAKIEKAIEVGILPITNERIRRLEDEHTRLEMEMLRLQREQDDWEKQFGQRWREEADRARQEARRPTP